MHACQIKGILLFVFYLTTDRKKAPQQWVRLDCTVKLLNKQLQF